MKVKNAQRKNTKLKLDKISIVDLTSVEMMYVHGGASLIPAGTDTLRTATTRTVQSVAPSGPCTGEPIGPIFATTISFSDHSLAGG